MNLFLKVILWADAALLATTWWTGWARPPVLGTPDEFHMPLGLLACVLTVLVQAQFLSYLITTSWDLRHHAEDQGKAPEAAVRARQIKGACLPWIALPALGAVASGILGMGVRALVVAPWAHRAVTGLTTLSAIGAAWIQPGLAAELDELAAQLGLDDDARGTLPNR